jgi:cyanophycin synthetase
VLETRVYRGPNIHSRRAMVRMRVDLGELEAWPTDKLPGFSTRLLEVLPGLKSHGCSCPDEGGLAHRIEQGTWLGHVIEHVALELQTLAGTPVSRGKTRSVRGHPGQYDILFRFRDEDLALAAGEAAVRLVLSLLPEQLAGKADESAHDVASVVAELAAVLARSALGPSTAALAEAARRRGIPVARLERQGFLRLGWGSRQQRLSASITSRTSHVAVTAAGNKDRTREILRDLGLPAPQGEVVRSAAAAWAAAQKLGLPVVIKPLDGNHGRGVTTDLSSEEAVHAAFAPAAAVGKRVIVEQHLQGKDHRVLVVDGKVVAVAEREPPSVVGDGKRSIAELIEELNADPRRGSGHENVLTRIKLDDALADWLERQGLQPSSVPGRAVQVTLRGTANLSSGGTATDRTDAIHPENRLIAEMAAQAVGLDVAGVDFVCPDIGRPVSETGGGIVEINAAPGLRMHLAPSDGQPRDVAGPVIDMLYPRGARSRVPVIAITGTNGKSTTARMVSCILRTAGLRVGMTNTSGVYIDDVLLRAGDASGPKSARMVLGNPAIDAAVLETARGGILREGLAFDYCAVGAVLNVSADHLGIKGIDTLRDLARVKSVVAKSVARKGAAVLNWDDRYTKRMAGKVRGRVIWFSLTAAANDPALAMQLQAGNGAVLRERGGDCDELVLYGRGRRIPIVAAQDIPATAGGHAHFNVANAMAAIAIASALDIEPAIIARALAVFASSYEDNPGRFNIIDDHPFRVILDYAHNPAGLKAFADCLPALTPGRGRTIGMVSIPGDRRDEDIVEIGRIALEVFDFVVFREGPDGRGRQRGDVLGRLEQGAAAASGSAGRFVSVLEEADAVAHCLTIARPGDLVALFPTRIADVYRQVKQHRGVEQPHAA